MPQLNDEAFLEYVLDHSKTERHAFHIADFNRLLVLSNVHEALVGDPGLGGKAHCPRPVSAQEGPTRGSFIPWQVQNALARAHPPAPP